MWLQQPGSAASPLAGLRRRGALLALICGLAWAGAAFAEARAQDFGLGEPTQELHGEGWEGFTNFRFLGHAVLTLLLATTLGAVIAYHPRSLRTADTLEEAEAPKTFLMYAVVGAVIGLMVVEYGLVVGFVVFGIGGLTRFRTDLPSATKTGRLIFVTLIGLSVGLSLPHLAVLATAFGFALIYVLDARITYRMEVKGLEEQHVPAAAERYRSVLARYRCRILNEKKSFSKARVTFIFQAPHRVGQEDLERAFDREIPEAIRGAVDWEID